MNEAWFRSLARQALHAPVYADPRFPPSPYYRFLRLLAAKLQPDVSVELGVAGCGGCLHLALGWKWGTVIGVETESLDDPAHALHERYAYVLRKFPRVEFWLRCDSVEAAGLFADRRPGSEVDILFIDTVHTYEQTMREWEVWQPHLSERAVVCLDDLDRTGMERAWQELPGRKVRLDILHTGATKDLGGGFGVVW